MKSALLCFLLAVLAFGSKSMAREPGKHRIAALMTLSPAGRFSGPPDRLAPQSTVSAGYRVDYQYAVAPWLSLGASVEQVYARSSEELVDKWNDKLGKHIGTWVRLPVTATFILPVANTGFELFLRGELGASFIHVVDFYQGKGLDLGACAGVRYWFGRIGLTADGGVGMHQGKNVDQSYAGTSTSARLLTLHLGVMFRQ